LEIRFDSKLGHRSNIVFPTQDMGQETSVAVTS
jgi:hypothetical protein